MLKNKSYAFLITVLVVLCVTQLSYAQDGEEDFQSNNSVALNTWLLRPKVGRITYEDDIYALGAADNLYFSITDMIDILELAIDFDQTTGVGQGWFLREDWPISINLPENIIVSKDVTYPLNVEDITTHEGITFIKQKVLSDVLNMTFKPDTAQQYVDIESPHPLPGVARYYRNLKKTNSNPLLSTAKLPRKNIEYDWLDINTADVRLSGSYRNPDVGRSTFFGKSSAAIEGQFLKHGAYAFVNADNRNNLTNVIARLSKRSETPSLLGPLKARSYTLGDTQITDIPLTGDARQELGFSVSNNKLDNIQFLTTDVNGDALPGWDVELYRNNILLSSLTVPDDSYFEFSNVQLFAGNNEFELFFYGPQGEVKTRKIEVPVTSTLLSTQDNTYNISASLSETNTLQKLRTDDVDRETPHIAARYNKVIGNMLAYLGVRNRDVEGDNKTFLGTGFTGLVKNTVIDGNFGIDNEANVASELSLRKNINNWNLSASGLVQSDDYIVNENLNPKVLKLSTNIQRLFDFGKARRATFFTSGEYSETADDREFVDSQIGMAYQHNRLNFSNSLNFSKTEQTNGDFLRRINNSSSLRGNFGKFFVRAGFDYNIHPTKKVDRYFSQLNYYPNNWLSGDWRLDHEPQRDYTRMRLGANYTNKRFRTSPFVEIDTEKDLLMGLNFNFNLIDVPSAYKPLMTSSNNIGRGLVSSFVYHDKNGNYIYDESDEPLEDVTIKSINVRRYAETNDKGYSLINGLPTTRATDIELDNDTLPDPYMLSAAEGSSIMPSAGEIVDLKFPVHMSGEVDGTAFIRDSDGKKEPLKRADIVLHPFTKGKKDKIIVKTAVDGFYVASQIPPGKYLAMIGDRTAKKFKAGLLMPSIVEIGYDGNIIYGLDFELDKSLLHIPVEVVYGEENYQDIQYVLNVRVQPKTKLLSLLKQESTTEEDPDPFKNLKKLENAEDGTQRYGLFFNNLKEGYTKCRELSEKANPCILQVHIPASDMHLAGNTAQ